MRKKKKDDIHETPDVSHINNPDVAHEASDVNVGSIAKFVGGLFVLTVVTFLLMKLLYNVMEDRAAKADPPRRPMALTEQERLPQGPRLQAAPGFGLDMGKGKEPINLQLREPQAEYNELNKIWQGVLKGEPDPRTGKAGMPIEQAIDQVVDENKGRVRAPAPGQEPVSFPGGIDVPSYQSSGRLTEKRDQ
jgi:hypothetical protein